ncbi:MAG: aminotransferase class I/II-fold pyridoxal phosphate-dependent enzyme [Deltaproteobacteria bacterium]|nr:aminotransferase class I/II-fold pyridoxal phosphate-dependent enzyme [Deltaproteobacteria bacterium]
MTRRMIDLRSDTVTRPTAGMRRAMAEAEVGDDVYGEDPTVNALEAEVARLVGKEASLFVPSGTMANQIALWCQSERGGEVVVGEGSHSLLFESGAMAALSGAQPVVAGRGGPYTAADVEAVLRPRTDYHPRSCMVVVENTHNWSGGRVFPQSDVLEIAGLARDRGLPLHLDGARLWNAAAATGLEPRTLCAPFDTVSVCLSKGLGAPVGSLLSGPRALVARARRVRKMLGGGMRQAGILAAAGLYALEHHRARIAVDHAVARAFAEQMASSPAVEIDPRRVETNIVVFGIRGRSTDLFLEDARREGVRLGVIGPGRVRAVTHLDVSEGDAAEASGILVRLLGR